MFDKDMLAEIFAEKLGACESYLEGLRPAEAEVVDVLLAIFPWLSRFHIECDGSYLRRRVWDDEAEDSTIAFTTPGDAGEQVRRWIKEHLERAEVTRIDDWRF